MRVTMLQTQSGSEDGKTLAVFAQGETVDIADSLARVFVQEGWATTASAAHAVDPEPAPVKRAARKGPQRRKG